MRPTLDEVLRLCGRAKKPACLDDGSAWLDTLSPDYVADLVRCVQAAEEIRQHMSKVSTCKCGGNSCGWCGKVKAFDAARARLGK